MNRKRSTPIYSLVGNFEPFHLLISLHFTRFHCFVLLSVYQALPDTHKTDQDSLVFPFIFPTFFLPSFPLPLHQVKMVSKLSLSPFDVPSPVLAHFNRIAGSTSGQDKIFMVYACTSLFSPLSFLPHLD